MDLIGQFIARYSKEYDFYDQASRLAPSPTFAHLRDAAPVTGLRMPVK